MSTSVQSSPTIQSKNCSSTSGSNSSKLFPTLPLGTLESNHGKSCVDLEVEKEGSLLKNSLFNKLTLEDGSLTKIKLSHFETHKTLGNGSFGVVYEVRHKPSGELFAAKTLRATLNRDTLKMIKRDVSMFENTNQSCKFIVSYKGVMTHMPDQYWILMEVTKTDLSVLVQRALAARHDPTKPLVDDFIIARIAFCIASGMSYLKTEMKMLHRDIKPSNVLVSPNAVFKLCDFGISTTLINSIAKTMNTGTILYVAPEKVSTGEDSEHSSVRGYGSASDVWSLGMVIYELICGHTFFGRGSDNKSQFELLLAIDDLTEDIKLPAQFANQTSPALAHFVEGCLRFEPGKRTRVTNLVQENLICMFDHESVKYIVEVEEYVDRLMMDNESDHKETSATAAVVQEE